jgi:hypothetical protein
MSGIVVTFRLIELLLQGGVPDRMKKYLEFVVSHISKSRCGAPRVGTTLSCQRARAFSQFL